MKTNNTKKGPNKQHNKKHAKIWHTASSGLIALYDIRPGNGAGPFLQPWSLHGALQAQGLGEGDEHLPTHS